MAKLHVTPEQFDWFQRTLNDPLLHESELVSRVKGAIAVLVLDRRSEGLENGQFKLVGTPACPRIELIVSNNQQSKDR